jgi:glycosyltransferase involved in cell wall biosynthesis
MHPTDSVPKKMRLFVVDHMCVLPYGHNRESVALFRRELAANFTESHALVPLALDAGTANARGFTRCLNFPYNAFSYRRFGAWFDRWIKSDQIRIWVQLVLRRIEKVVLTGLMKVLPFDVVLWLTERNWKKLFRTYDFSGDDLIFFPSADFYGAGACLHWIAKGKTRNPPRIHLRMVNVMENASLSSSSAREVLITRVRTAIAQGIDVSMSGETPAYISYLAEKLGRRVEYFPYPLCGNSVPMPRLKPVVAAAIGSGRGDKGYFLWADIAQKTAMLSTEPVAFEIQAMPRQDHEFNPEYEISLANIPNVRVFPATLTDQDMVEFYQRGYVVVLPYDPKVYEYRGSAIMQEAIAYTRPVVCLAGAAYADSVGRYQNGYVCRNIEEMVAAIAECASIPPAEWDRRLKIARKLYAEDVQEAMERILGGERVREHGWRTERVATP